jgi:hypothetical protein
MQFLPAITIQATLVLLAAFAMSFLLRRSSASARHLVWTLALAAVMALPLLSLLAPRVPTMTSPVGRVVQEITVTASGCTGPEKPGAAQRTDNPLCVDGWSAARLRPPRSGHATRGDDFATRYED